MSLEVVADAVLDAIVPDALNPWSCSTIHVHEAYEFGFFRS